MTDRLGLKKLYYSTLGTQGLLFASEVKALLAHPGVRRTVDLQGLTQFLAFEHLLEDRTLYEGVRLLRGGMCLSYSVVDGTLTLTPYWTARFITAANRRSLNECADELAQRLTVAVDDHLRDARRIGIPLSGGLDSRALAGFTRRLRPGAELRTSTAGHRHTYDVVFARRIARVCRTRHAMVPLAEDFLARWGASFAWLTEAW